MARKRPAKEKEVEATIQEPTLKPVRVDLSPDIHRLLRRVAADDGKSMAGYVRDHLEVHLRDEAKRRGIKP